MTKQFIKIVITTKAGTFTYENMTLLKALGELHQHCEDDDIEIIKCR